MNREITRILNFLERSTYKMKNQHKNMFYFKKLVLIKRIGKKIKENREKNLLIVLREETIKCYIHFRALFLSTFFTSLSATMLSYLAKLFFLIEKELK